MRHPWLSGVVVLVSILVLILVHQVVQVRADVEHLSQVLDNQFQHFNEKVIHLQRELQRMEEAAAWYARPTFDLVGITEAGDAVQVSLTWKFNELSADAEVGLNYQMVEGEWEEAVAEKVSSLTYRAEFEVPLAGSDPPIFMQFTSRTSGQYHDEMQAESQGPIVHYFITARDGDQQRSAEEETIDLSRIMGVYHLNVAGDGTAETYQAKIDLVHRGAAFEVFETASAEIVLFDDNDREISRLQLESFAGAEQWHGLLESAEAPASVQTLITFIGGPTAEITFPLVQPR